MAQSELKSRAKGNFNHSSANPFSSKIICGECGGFYGSKVWHSNDKYRRVIWQCDNKFKNKKKCKTPHLTEGQIKEEFVKSFNVLINNKDEVIKDCENTVLNLIDLKQIDTEINNLQEKCTEILSLIKLLISENARKAINQEQYNKKYISYTKEYEKIKGELSRLEEEKQNLKVRRDKVKIFVQNLEPKSEIISEFDENLWYSLVEKVVVNSDEQVKFIFRNEI